MVIRKRTVLLRGRPPTTGGEKTRVLVVDGSELLADQLPKLLNGRGFEARGLTRGDKALDVMRQFQPHILVCERLLWFGKDESGGEKLIPEAKILQPDLKVVVYSACTEPTRLGESEPKFGKTADRYFSDVRQHVDRYICKLDTGAVPKLLETVSELEGGLPHKQ